MNYLAYSEYAEDCFNFIIEKQQQNNSLIIIIITTITINKPEILSYSIFRLILIFDGADFGRLSSDGLHTK